MGYIIGYIIEGVMVIGLLIAIILTLRKPAAAATESASASEGAGLTATNLASETAATAAQEPIDLTGATIIQTRFATFEEAYKALDVKQKGLMDSVRRYVLNKPGAEERMTTAGIHIKIGARSLVRLTVRRGMTIALFLLGNDLLKNYRKKDADDVKIKVKPMELKIRDVKEMEAAKQMVDLVIQQMEREKQAQREARRAARSKPTE